MKNSAENFFSRLIQTHTHTPYGLEHFWPNATESIKKHWKKISNKTEVVREYSCTKKMGNSGGVGGVG